MTVLTALNQRSLRLVSPSDHVSLHSNIVLDEMRSHLDTGAHAACGAVVPRLDIVHVAIVLEMPSQHSGNLQWGKSSEKW